MARIEAHVAFLFDPTADTLEEVRILGGPVVERVVYDRDGKHLKTFVLDHMAPTGEPVYVLKDTCHISPMFLWKSPDGR
jgi:hypothetical protein